MFNVYVELLCLSMNKGILGIELQIIIWLAGNPVHEDINLHFNVSKWNIVKNHGLVLSNTVSAITFYEKYIWNVENLFLKPFQKIVGRIPGRVYRLVGI